MITKVETLFVKKFITQKEWEEYYKFTDYVYLGKEEDRGRCNVKIGFMIANPEEDGEFKYSKGFLPYDCEPLSGNERKEVKKVRESFNIHPA